MSSGSKKGTQIYFHFLSKSPGKQIPPRFPSGVCMERDTCFQGIFTYLLIYLYLKGPKKKASLHVPQKAGPLWKQTPIPEP
jgi:hypothetical protein